MSLFGGAFSARSTLVATIVVSSLGTGGCASMSTATGGRTEIDQAMMMTGEQRSFAFSTMRNNQVLFVSARNNEPISLKHGCQLTGVYGYVSPGSVAYDSHTIHTAGWLEQNYRLLGQKNVGVSDVTLKVTTVGTYLMTTAPPVASQLHGPDCKAATHYVSGASMGAVTLDGLDAKQKTLVLGGNILHLTEEELREIQTRGGDPEKCKPQGEKPPEGCATIVRLQLSHIDGQPLDERSVAPIVLTVLGGVAVIAGGALYMVGQSKRDTAEKTCNQSAQGCSSEDLAPYHNFHYAGVGALGVGAAALVSGGIWWGTSW